MGRYTSARRRPMIVDPTKEKVDLTDFTSKIFPLVLTPDKERFPFVIEGGDLWFYRRRPDGQIEKVPKRNGKGYAGGGGGGAEHPGETPVDAATREGEEELGATREFLAKRIREDICCTAYYGAEKHPFHLFYVPVEEDDVSDRLVKRNNIKDPKLITLKVGNKTYDKVAWAYLRELGQSIFAPKNREEREELEAKGDVWFYHGHTTLLVAMLLKLVKEEVITGKQRNLPWIVFQKIAPFQNFSRRTIEMLAETGEPGLRLLYGRLRVIARNENLSFRAASVAVSLGLDELHERIVTQADKEWKDKLARHVKTALRQKRAQGPFESLEAMDEFLANEPFEDITDEDASVADDGPIQEEEE